MIKTFEIDLDDALVENAGKIFETLGTDIDTAIKMFLTQATLRKGFPFDVAIPQENENGELKIENSDSPVKVEPATLKDAAEMASVPPELAARVAANEALVAEMREEIGDKAVTPEFDENEDDGTHGDYDASPVESVAPATSDKSLVAADESAADRAASAAANENPSGSESDDADEEDEDETTPDNLFDAWDVGEEEDIGCR